MGCLSIISKYHLTNPLVDEKLLLAADEFAGPSELLNARDCVNDLQLCLTELIKIFKPPNVSQWGLAMYPPLKRLATIKFRAAEAIFVEVFCVETSSRHIGDALPDLEAKIRII